MTDEGKTKQEVDQRAANEATAKQLATEASQQIEILTDRVELEDYSSEKELAQIQVDLKRWKKYRIELNKFIGGQREEMPEL